MKVHTSIGEIVPQPPKRKPGRPKGTENPTTKKFRERSHPEKTTRYSFELPIRTEYQLELFMQAAFGISFPKKAVCPGHVSVWEALCTAFFAKDPLTVWLASRGSGKTFAMAGLALAEAVGLGVDVNVLGGSGEQSKRVHEAISAAWQHQTSPKYLLTDDPQLKLTRFTMGNQIQALMASQTSVRGGHPCRLRLDEVDVMDIDIFDAAMGQPMGQNGSRPHVLASSTWQNARGSMAEVLRRADERGWPVQRWCFKEILKSNGGWLDDAEIDLKRNIMTNRMFRVEMELEAPTGQGMAIMPEAIDKTFRAELGEYDDFPSDYIEVEPPLPGALYVHGADWARKTDYTVIITLRIDTVPHKVVAYERMNRLMWPIMVKKLDDRIQRYNGECVHDASGLGDVVDQYLSHPATPVIFTAKVKAEIVSAYIAAVERGEIVSPKIRTLEADHRYATVGDVYASGEGHLPDTMCAMALAYHAVANGLAPLEAW